MHLKSRAKAALFAEAELAMRHGSQVTIREYAPA